MFLPGSDSWPYTNLLESIYRGNSANTEGTLSGIAAVYREREEQRVVEGWASPENEQEQEKSEMKEVRRKLPERALKILHLFFQNISPSPSPAQQTDLLTFIHTTIPGAGWFGPNSLRAWFISRRSEVSARRLLAVAAGEREQQLQLRLRAQGTLTHQEPYEGVNETCESILYPTLTAPKITKLAILYRTNPTPNKNAIEVWARALKADLEDVVNWVQIHGGGGGGGNGNIPPPVVNSYRQNPSPTTSSSPANIVPQYTPIPWWPSTAPHSPTSTAPPSAPPSAPPPPPPPSHSSPPPPPPQSQHAHKSETTSHIPYRRHPAMPHQYRGAAAPRHPYAKVYRSPVEVCPTTATTTTTAATTAATTTTTGEARRALPVSLPFSLSSARLSSLPSYHTKHALEERDEDLRVYSHSNKRGGQTSNRNRAIRPRPVASSTHVSPSSELPDERELFDPATLRDLISVPAQYRQPRSHTLPHIFPPSHPHRPPRPYPHLLRHILAHTQSHTHARSHDFNQKTSRQTSESPVVDHDKECAYDSAARSSLSAVLPPSFDFDLDLGPSVFSSAPLPVRSSPVIDLTGPDDNDVDMGVPIDPEFEESATVSTTKEEESSFPPASTHPTFAEPSDSSSDEEGDDGEPMDLESDDDEDLPHSKVQLQQHRLPDIEPEPRDKRNILAELATFVHERLAYSQANGSVGLAKREEDFDATLGVCEAFYERIRSGVYAGVGRGLVLLEGEGDVY